MFLKAILLTALLYPPQTDTLETAVVSTDRDPSATASAPTYVMSSATLERRGARELHEALRTLPGVNIRDYGGLGGLKTVSVRGFGAQHTSVVLDGAVMSDAQNAQIDLSGFNLESMSSLTMDIGVSDNLFRPARTITSAGVLSLESKAPDLTDKPYHLQARMRAASFGTFNPYVSYQRKLSGSWYCIAGADYLTSKGDYPFTVVNGTQSSTHKRLGADVESVKAELRLAGTLRDGGSLSFNSNYLYSERGLPGSVVLYVQDPTERLWDRKFTGNVRYDNFWKDKFRLRAGLGYNYSWNRYLNNSAAYAQPEEDLYRQDEAAASVIAEYRISEALRLVAADDLSAARLDSSLPGCPFPSRLSNVAALSAGFSTERLSASASLAWTSVREKVMTGEAAPDRDRLSPSAGISYLIGNGFRLRASYKEGFRVPTFNDLYYAKVGERNLKPEKSRQAGLGATWSGNVGKMRLSVSADGYRNGVKDKILAVPTMFIWKMRNLGSVKMTGLDVNVSVGYPLSGDASLRLDANGSYLEALDLSDKESKCYGHQIQYTPKHSGNIIASLQAGRFNVSYTMYASGKRYFLPQNVQENCMEAYFDHSVSASRTFTLKECELSISAEALNIGNSNYEIIRYYPMPGRNYRITLKLSL